MSDTVIQVDRRLPIAQQVKQTYFGPKNVSYYKTTAVDPTNPNTHNYPLILPSGRTSGVSRKMYRQITGTITYTDTVGDCSAAGATILNAGHLSTSNQNATGGLVRPNYTYTLRPNALELSTVNTTVDLANTGLSLSQARISDIYNAQSYYQGGQTVQAGANSTFNSKTARFNTFTNYAGDASSPFAPTSMVPTSETTAMPSGAYITSMTYTSATLAPAPAQGSADFYNSVTIGFSISEPVYIGLFEPQNEESEYLFGTDRINVLIQMLPTADKFVCIQKLLTIVPGTLNTPVQSIIPSFLLSGRVTFATNDLLYSVISVEEQSIPRLLRYPYRNYQINVTNKAQINDGIFGAGQKNFSMSSNTIPLSSIPYGFLIYAKPQEGQISASMYPNIFYPLVSVSCQFDNQSGVLDVAQGPTLYDICRRNGLTRSYPEFQGQTVPAQILGQGYQPAVIANVPSMQWDILNGCPVFIKSSDLPRTAFVGESHPTNVSFQCTFNNNVPVLDASCANGATANYGSPVPATVPGFVSVDLFVVSIYEDLVEIDMTTGTAIRKQIYITPQDIAEGTYYRKHGSTMKSSMTGGSFWSDAGNSLLGALGAFKDGATFNIPAIVDRITGKKTGFGGQKGHGSVSKEQILEQLKR